MSILLVVLGFFLSIQGAAKRCSQINDDEICPLAPGCIWEGASLGGTCKKDPAATCSGDPCDVCFDYYITMVGGYGYSCPAPCKESHVKPSVLEYDVCSTNGVSSEGYCGNVKVGDCAGFSSCYAEGGSCKKDACNDKEAICAGECSVKNLGVGVSECITTAKHTLTDPCTYYSDNVLGGVNVCNLGENCTAREVTLLDGTKGVICESEGSCNCKVQLVGPYYVDSDCGGDGPNTLMTNKPGLKIGDNRNYQSKKCPYHIVDTNNNDQWVGWTKAADLRTESGAAFSLGDDCCRADSGARTMIPMLLIGAILFFLFL